MAHCNKKTSKLKLHTECLFQGANEKFAWNNWATGRVKKYGKS
jgi:hypothetical protein